MSFILRSGQENKRFAGFDTVPTKIKKKTQKIYEAIGTPTSVDPCDTNKN